METETPGRPFESLEWYRAAVRSSQSDERGVARLLTWLRGVEFLTAHISVFAVGIVALLIINLLRSPEDLWVDRVGAAWAMLLIIHGVGIGLVWAIALLGKDDDEALQVIPSAEWRHTSPSWPRAVKVDSPAGSHPQSVTPGVARSREELAAQPARLPVPLSADGQQAHAVPPSWSAWGHGSEPSSPADEPKASWREAAVWLTQSDRGRQPTPTEGPPSDPPLSGGSSPT